MRTDIKIGIVEDELIIAEKIKALLLSIGYTVCDPVSSYLEALGMIEEEKPDLLLLDINLGDKKDGIDLARKINESYQTPFIFLTANSDSATVERSKEVKPLAFLVKPFNKEGLFSSIEIAFSNFESNKPLVNSIGNNIAPRDFIFIKENHKFIKVLFQEIVFIESCENYVFIHTKDKQKSIVRSTFNDFLSQLPADKFVRTHRSYAVQLALIEKVEPTEITASGHKIALSNSNRAAFYKILGLAD